MHLPPHIGTDVYDDDDDDDDDDDEDDDDDDQVSQTAQHRVGDA